MFQFELDRTQFLQNAGGTTYTSLMTIGGTGALTVLLDGTHSGPLGMSWGTDSAYHATYAP